MEPIGPNISCHNLTIHYIYVELFNLNNKKKVNNT